MFALSTALSLLYFLLHLQQCLFVHTSVVFIVKLPVEFLWGWGKSVANERNPNARRFSGLRAVNPNGSLTELALLRRCRDGPGQSVVTEFDGKYNGAIFEVRIECSHYGVDGNRPVTYTRERLPYWYCQCG